MKKILLAVIMVLMMVGVASAIELNLVPYTELRAWSDSENTDPVIRYGVKLEADNIFMGAGLYVAFEGGKIDTRTDEVKSVCTNPDGCVWPADFITAVEQGKSYTAIFTGMRWKVNLLSK